MGGFLSVLLNLGDLIPEITAATGLTAESILTGEALAAVETEVAALTLEGFSGIEALAQLGLTTEQFSNLLLISSVIQQGVAYGTVFQTVSGLSSLISAGIKYSQEQFSNVNRQLILQGADSNIRRTLMAVPFNPLEWGNSLISIVGNKPLKLNPQLKSALVNSRWIIQKKLNSNDYSGDIIKFYPSPGGAGQESIPDWMLALILGLSGDTTPELRNLQHGS